MSSFTKDTTHYAHPLFQTDELPKPIAKKNKTPNKKLPKWMTHTVKQGYTSYLVHTNATTLEPKDYRPPRHVGGFEPAGNQFELFEDSNDLEEFEPSGATIEQKEVAEDIKKRLEKLENNNDKVVKVLKKRLKKIVDDYEKNPKRNTTEFMKEEYLIKEKEKSKLNTLKDADLIYDIINFKKLLKAFQTGDKLSETRKRAKEKQQKEKKKKEDREQKKKLVDRGPEKGAYLSEDMKKKVEKSQSDKKIKKKIKDCVKNGSDKETCTNLHKK